MRVLLGFFCLINSAFSYSDVVCQQTRQNDDEAKKQILFILEKNPNHTRCILKLASINLKKGSVIEGFELISRAYSQDPHAVRKDSLSKVLPYALKVTGLLKQAKHNGDGKSWYKVGNILFEIGVFKEAAKAYEVSLVKKENQIKGRFMYALSLQNSGQIYRAIGEYKKLLQQSENHFLANYYLGKLLRHQIYDECEAIKYIKRAYELLIVSKNDFQKKEYNKYYEDLTKEIRSE